MSSRANKSGKEEFNKRALDPSDNNNVDKQQKKTRRIAPNWQHIKTSPMTTRTHTQVICFNAREKSIHFGIFAKPDGSAAFDAPPANAVRDRPDFALDHLHILGVASQRDASDIARNVALPQGPNSPYPRRLFTFLPFVENQPKQEFLDQFCPIMTAWANETDAYMGTHNLFVPRETAESSGPDVPVRHLVRDRDMMLLLKKIYGWEGQNSLQDIMDNEEILQKFFDTVDEGRAFLRLFSEDQWQNLEA
jgi:hypothetical protein